MLNYETPEVEFIWFEVEDILTTSDTGDIVIPDPGGSDWE